MGRRREREGRGGGRNRKADSQNMLGSVVKRERPEKKPTSSVTVNTRVRLSATNNLQGGGGGHR